MPIHFQSSDRTFFLQAKNSTYAFSIDPKLEIPIHRFWGRQIAPSDLSLFTPAAEACFSPNPSGLKPLDSPDIWPQELPTHGHGDFRQSGLTISQQDGSRVLELRYSTHRILPGKPGLKGLPATYVEQAAEAETLEVDLVDAKTGLLVVLSYTVFRDFDAIARSVYIRNDGTAPVQIQELASASLDFTARPLEVIHLAGAWGRERHLARQPLTQCSRLVVESRRGTSSHQANPFLALVDPETSETNGEAFAFSLVYSGNFSASVESDQFCRPRAMIGLNSGEFSWLLAAGEGFQSPEAVLVYSGEGLGAMSHTFHKLYRTRLARGSYRDKVRPVLLNNWEATYFDFTEEKITSLAAQAASAGIELLVLDDGWFGKRDSDTCSLGDWVVNDRKLPNGIAGLAKKVNQIGLQFGLWFEPEMVSPDSDLYRAHPDWCLHVPGRDRTESRRQLVLDFSRTEVCDYVIGAVGAILDSAPIRYVKWDMNRHLTEVWSPALPPENQGEVGHRYVLGLYRVLEELVSRFPEVLFEGCSGGGGRFDPGLLHYMPQSWTSDNSDAISRLKIQYGTSLVYPWSSMAAHVSAVPNHQHERVTPLDTRFHVALTGAFGYELDLGHLPPTEMDEIRQQVLFYKKHRKLLAEGELYRLQSPFRSNQTAWMIVSPGQEEALVIHVNVQVEANLLGSLLRLRGLNPEAEYLVSGFEKPLRGDVLINVGLPVPSRRGDFQSHCWHLSRHPSP